MANEKPTKKEIEKEREERRGYALKYLKNGNFLDLATAYFTQNDKNFGETDNQAFEEFLYTPAFNSAVSGDVKYTALDEEGNKVEIPLIDISAEGIRRKREGGRRYSGRMEISEYNTISKAAQIVMESVGSIKVEDLMDLIGSGINVLDIKEVYQNRYISDLLQSENEEEKKLAGQLLGGYRAYIATQKVSEALGLRAAAIRGGLEKIVNEEQGK
ncbi:MAG: hypothetical protein U1B79_01265 [Candidatus Pacearchaeota archaeon]|nr:hypothetical protein [Nanoarchaeota archaeon]MDZ4226720.1 hypothetical protein [Candidatus Pacearchaeota archaeon]